MASVETRRPLLRCSHWDPASLPASVSAESVEPGTARQGRDGRRWVCCEILSDSASPVASSSSSSPTLRPPPPSAKSATLCGGGGGGAQASVPTAVRSRTTKPSDRATPARTGSSPRFVATATAAAAVDDNGRAETKTVSTTTTTTTAAASSSSRPPPPSSRRRVWALAADEVPVWRRANRSGLHNRDWWRHSTIAGIDAFEVRDYGARGDCFFLAVTAGLRHNFAYFRDWSAAQQLRELAAAQITPHTVDAFLDSERRERRLGPSPPRADAADQVYAWRPDAIARVGDVNERVRALRRVIKTAGNTYWGDRLTLAYLCQSPLFRELDIGFVVFTADGVVHPEVVTSRDSIPVAAVTTDRAAASDQKIGRAASASTRPRHLMLLYNSGAHWQLVFFCSSRRPVTATATTTTAAVAPVSTHASPRKTPTSTGTPKLVEQRDAVVRLPARAANLPEPLRHVFAASWAAPWWTTLGYSADGK